ncbi:curli-like amyloid fiber formation chaperone CsgH [Burkholderia cepacia]|uniref:curli-like amyloid fiber formation chaperone CsgH n=1 Tax=Burkholderia cepacia TaxID=292 RepID=UPI001590CC45|nr:curli-like amyloid fiber formation chaperone CsgH [Burkholderia cepacia]
MSRPATTTPRWCNKARQLREHQSERLQQHRFGRAALSAAGVTERPDGYTFGLFFIRQGTIMVGIHDLNAYFDIAASAGGVNIVPHVRAAAPVDVSYSLRITRTGGAGSASLTRSGESRLAGGEDQPLATLLLSVDSSDICKATLVLHVNGEHAEYSVDCNPHRTAG